MASVENDILCRHTSRLFLGIFLSANWPSGPAHVHIWLISLVLKEKWWQTLNISFNHFHNQSEPWWWKQLPAAAHSMTVNQDSKVELKDTLKRNFSVSASPRETQIQIDMWSSVNVKILILAALKERSCLVLIVNLAISCQSDEATSAHVQLKPAKCI